MKVMHALRRLVAFLGCLAAMMSVLPTMALAWTPTADVAPENLSESLSCPHCQDCDPCQTANAACVQVCVSPLPTLGATGPDLPTVDMSGIGMSGRLVVLHGLSPPPEPFPPRS